jgi:hypothetical protein
VVPEQCDPLPPPLLPFLILYIADLNRFYEIALRESGQKNNYKMSTALLLKEIKKEMPETEVADLEEVRKLLRCLSFKFGNMHSDHYFKIGQRSDVVQHRNEFAPLYHSLLSSPKAWVVCADATFFHENAYDEHSWFTQSGEGGNLLPAKVGKGQRLNVWEFLTAEGLLLHPDGTMSFLLLWPSCRLIAYSIRFICWHDIPSKYYPDCCGYRSGCEEGT